MGNSGISAERAMRAVDIIMSRTNGTDGRFNYLELVREGVPARMAVDYAGVLEAHGQCYTAPASVRSAIDAAARTYIASMADRTVPDMPRVRGVVTFSYAGCEEVRRAVLGWWPFAYCQPDPRRAGAWLVILY